MFSENLGYDNIELTPPRKINNLVGVEPPKLELGNIYSPHPSPAQTPHQTPSKTRKILELLSDEKQEDPEDQKKDEKNSSHAKKTSITENLKQYANKKINKLVEKVVPDAPFFRKISIIQGLTSGFFIGSGITEQLCSVFTSPYSVGAKVANYLVGTIAGASTGYFASEGVGEYINYQTIHAATLEEQDKNIKKIQKKVKTLKNKINHNKEKAKKLYKKEEVVEYKINKRLGCEEKENKNMMPSPASPVRVLSLSIIPSALSPQPTLPLAPLETKKGLSGFQEINTGISAVSGYFLGFKIVQACFNRFGPNVSNTVALSVSYSVGGMSCALLAYLAYKGIHEYIHSQKIHQETIRENDIKITQLEQEIKDLKPRMTRHNQRISELKINKISAQRKINFLQGAGKKNSAWGEEKKEEEKAPPSEQDTHHQDDKPTSCWTRTGSWFGKMCGAPFYQNLSTVQSSLSGYFLGYSVVNQVLDFFPPVAAIKKPISYGLGIATGLFNGYHAFQGIKKYKTYKTHYEDILNNQNTKITAIKKELKKMYSTVKQQTQALQELERKNRLQQQLEEKRENDDRVPELPGRFESFNLFRKKQSVSPLTSPFSPFSQSSPFSVEEQDESPAFSDSRSKVLTDDEDELIQAQIRVGQSY